MKNFTEIWLTQKMLTQIHYNILNYKYIKLTWNIVTYFLQGSKLIT